ncbi:hypothetical protein [Desulfurobacterium sp.]|uniref:hypothetical protein n=1 Tax=Desulfurobacterium sp. TaxID=2004706 RepID=UPI00261B0652|nr:hypothetical protein [Desulfurobacterium sp.]
MPATVEVKFVPIDKSEKIEKLPEKVAYNGKIMPERDFYNLLKEKVEKGMIKLVHLKEVVLYYPTEDNNYRKVKAKLVVEEK